MISGPKTKKGIPEPDLWIKILVLATASLSWWAGYGFVALITLLLSLTVLVRDRFKFSIATSLLASFSVLVSYNCFIGGIFWLLKLKLSYTAMYLFIIMVPLCLSLYFARLSGFNFKFKLSKAGLIKLGALVFASILLFGNQVIKLNSPYYLELMFLGGDNISHVEHTLTVRDNQGYLYDTVTNIQNKLTVSHAGYPEGMHLNYFILIQGFDELFNLKDSWVNLSKFLMLAFTTVYLLLFIAILELLLLVPSKLNSWSTLALAIGAGSITLSQPITYFLYGAQVEIFDLVLFLTQVVLASALIDSKFKKPRTSRSDLVMIMLGFINIGILFSWLFIGPVSLIFSFIIMLIYLKEDFIKLKNFKFSRSFIAVLIFMGVFAAFAMIQYLVQTKFGIKSNPITEPGFIDTNVSLFKLAIVGTISYLLIRFKNFNRSLLLAFIVGLGFALFIGAWQLKLIGEFRYYYFKATHIPTILGLGAGITIIVDLLFGESSQLKSGVQKLGGFFILAIIYWSLLYRIAGTYVLAWVDTLPDQESVIVDQQFKLKKRVLSLGSCNRASDFLITRLSQVLSRTNDSYSQSFSFGILSSSNSEFTRSLYSYSYSNLTIIANTPEAYLAINNTKLAENSLLPNYNDGLEKQSCPGALY
jgi:hypothetical protein